MVKPTLKTTRSSDGKEYYVIATANDLRQFRNMVNGLNGHVQNLAANAILTTDIGLNQGLNPNITSDRKKCLKWIPICIDYKVVYTGYTGIFDGNGHTVSGVYVSDVVLFAGLFGSIGEAGTVKNLTIDRSFIENRSTTGAAGSIVGWNQGKIFNCRAQSGVYVNGRWDIGGIVGRNRGSMFECQSYATVNGVEHAGGLTGYNYGKITGCENYGSVSGGQNSTGGLVGVLYGSLSNSRNFTDGLPD